MFAYGNRQMELTRVLPLFLGLAVHVSIARAQSPGTFTTTGNLVTPRYYHSATLLLDGKVLLAGGGTRSSSAQASAELYDPVTGTFAATGSMTVPRIFHTATLLPSGKVLIAGGTPNSGGGYPVATAELYDPATGTFAPTGDMLVPRSPRTATLLHNGKVLLAGGNFLAGAELYDPDTGTFAVTGDMNEPSCDTATLLPNGKVLLTRGVIYDPDTDLETFVRHAELYDPATNKFTFTGDMVFFHSSPTATLLTNGKVLIAGGDWGDGDGPSANAELYDPTTGIFTATSNMTSEREDHTATLLTDGSVLIAGGHNVWYGASAEVYYPVRKAFSYIPGMPTARDYHRATLLDDGTVLVSGGFEFWISHNLLSAAQLYTPAVVSPPLGLLSVSGDGRGPGAIWHARTGQIASADNPAVTGEVLSMYTTGLGDGSVVPPQVAIGGRLGEILFFGSAPGYPGYNQVNVRVPDGVAPGSAVPVRLTYLGRSSNQVTIGLR